MSLYPLFADLTGREVLVVGAGDVAARKIGALLKAGAVVRVHAHTVPDPEVATWLQQGTVTRLHGEFDPAWLDVVWLVVAATDDVAFNARLADEAGRRRRLVNVVDDAELSTFQVPALVDRSPLMIAISSAGAAPMLARRVRERLETLLDPGLGRLAALFGTHRERIRSALPDMRLRRRWFERVLDAGLEARLRTAETGEGEAEFLELLDRADDGQRIGQVTLVVAPDDPDLLTLRALRSLNEADTIVVAAGLGSGALEPARRDAHRVAAGPDVPAQAGTLAMHGDRVVVAVPHEDPALAAVLEQHLAALGVRCLRASPPPLYRDAAGAGNGAAKKDE